MQPQKDDNLTTADLASAGERKTTDQPVLVPPGPRMLEEQPQKRVGSGAEPKDVGDGPKPHLVEDRSTPLFSQEEAQRCRSRWAEVQTGFVDEPRRAVEQADSLVAETIKRLAEVFAEERRSLEGQWGRGDQVSTEDLRLALRRYRSFFDRLLSV
jgi:hypothetical protein